MTTQVDRNYEAFKALLPALLPIRRDEYALMRDGEILEFFPTAVEAYASGFSRFGIDGFSLQKVTDEVIDLGWFSRQPAFRGRP